MIITIGREVSSRVCNSMYGDIIFCRNEAAEIRKTIKDDELRCVRMKWNERDISRGDENIVLAKFTDSKFVSAHSDKSYVPIDKTHYVLLSSKITIFQILRSDIKYDFGREKICEDRGTPGRNIGIRVTIDVLATNEKRTILLRNEIYSFDCSVSLKLAHAVFNVVLKRKVELSFNAPPSLIFYSMFFKTPIEENFRSLFANEIGTDFIQDRRNRFTSDHEFAFDVFGERTTVNHSFEMKKYFLGLDSSSCNIILPMFESYFGNDYVLEKWLIPKNKKSDIIDFSKNGSSVCVVSTGKWLLDTSIKWVFRNDNANKESLNQSHILEDKRKKTEEIKDGVTEVISIIPLEATGVIDESVIEAKNSDVNSINLYTIAEKVNIKK